MTTLTEHCNRDHSYNGWSNYETWCTNLWLTNDEYTYRIIQHIARSTISDYEAAQRIKQAVYDLLEESPLGERVFGLFRDLLSGALSEVDWWEIAQAHQVDQEDDNETI